MLGAAASNGQLPLSGLSTRKRKRLLGNVGHARGIGAIAASDNVATQKFLRSLRHALVRGQFREARIGGVKAARRDDPSWFAAEADVCSGFLSRLASVRERYRDRVAHRASRMAIYATEWHI